MYRKEGRKHEYEDECHQAQLVPIRASRADVTKACVER